MLDPTVHAALAAILPPSALLTTPEETKPYECDGLTLYREMPAAVLLPDSEAQVIAILQRCHESAVPVVARGAGTRLSGGAVPASAGGGFSLAPVDPDVLFHRPQPPAGALPRGRAPPL